MIQKILLALLLIITGCTAVFLSFKSPGYLMFFPSIWFVLFALLIKKKKTSRVKRELHNNIKEIKTLMKGRTPARSSSNQS